VTPAPDPIPVRTLLGAKGFDTSLTCLGSLLRYSVDPLRLVVHEDGTLTEEYRDRLRALDPLVEVIDRAEADRVVTDRLAKYPRCRAARQSEIMFLKLFDIVLLAPGRVAYCDSDFLFLRRYRGLFAEPADPARPVFMTDVGHAYAVRPWHLRPLGPVRLVGRLNAGLTLAPAAYLDLDHLEWLLGVIADHPVFDRRPYWKEQTCWAALAGRTGAGLLDRRRVVMATRSMGGYTEDAVAIHFVQTHRGRLPEYAARQRPADEPPVTVEVRPARPVSPVGMGFSDLYRRWIA
jgi:hypothetical protein